MRPFKRTFSEKHGPCRSVAIAIALCLFVGARAEMVLAQGCCGNGPCCCGDSPGCSCFKDGGSWNPHGTNIQDVALQTLGTEESYCPTGPSTVSEIIWAFS